MTVAAAETMRDILTWAAGVGNGGPPPPTEVDEDALLDLVEAHALETRFAARLDRHGDAFAPRVREATAELRLGVERRVREHAAAVAVLGEELRDDAALIVLKGMASSLLTGRRELMRSGDIDVLVRPGTDAEPALRRLGYRRTRAPFMHEIGEFTRGSTEIDLHALFPVYAYPEAIRGSDLRGDRHPGTWPQGAPFEARSLTHAIAAADAVRPPHAPPPGVLVPGAEAQAIVLCAHGFMNYVNAWSISHRAKPLVRLAELADVAELARHPAFDAARFRALVDRLAATDAVEWAAAAARELLGIDLFGPEAGIDAPALDAARFPRCLWWHFWAELPLDIAALTGRWWLPMDRVVAALGAAELEPGTAYATVETTDARRVPRMLTLPGGDVVPFRMRVDRSGDRLTVQVRLDDRPAATDRVRVDLGSRAAEWAWSGDGEPQLVGDGHATLVAREAAYDVTLTLPVAAERAEARAAGGSTSLLAGVTRVSRDGAPVASTLVPAVLAAGEEGARG